MGAVGVMIAPPAGDATNILKAVEDLAVEQFVLQAGIEFRYNSFPKGFLVNGERGDAEPWELGAVLQQPQHEFVLRADGQRQPQHGIVLGPTCFRWKQRLSCAEWGRTPRGGE